MIPVLSSKKIITNEDTKTSNFDNNVVVDGYGGVKITDYVKYADGKQQELDYYSFVRGSNGENTLIDVNDVTQQYEKVSGCVVTLTSPITPTNYNDVSFEAILNAGIVPAENDLMVLRLLDGRYGMFKVSNITKRTYIMKKMYNVTGVFLYYSDMNSEFFTNLELKVVKRYVYDKTAIGTNSNPVILESKFKDRVNLSNYLTELLDAYLEEYLYEKVICFNAINGRVHDNNIQNVIMTVLDDRDYANIKIVDRTQKAYNIVDRVLNKRESLSSNKMYAYYDIVSVVNDINAQFTTSILSSDVGNITRLSETPSANLNKNVELKNNNIIPSNFRTSEDNRYLFDEVFYTGKLVGTDNELSLLEYLLLGYMEGSVLNTTKLEEVVQDIPNWSYIEKFHYIPFLLLLLNYSTLNSYSRI